MKPARFIPTLFAISLLAATTITPAFADPNGTGTNFETRLSTIEDSQRDLNGRLEQLEFAIRRLDQNMQRLQIDIDSRLGRLEATPAAQQQPMPQPVPQQPPAQPQIQGDAAPANPEPNGSLGALKMQNGRVTGSVDNPQAPPLPPTPPDYGLTTQEQYDAAFALLRQADYEGAEKSFKSFIDKNPKDKLTDNAKYWYGETLYVRGKLDEAAVAFADAWQQNPQGVKAPDSLLKLAMSLAAINKVQDACTSLGELKEKYPNASPTIRSRASEEAVKIKCGSH